MYTDGFDELSEAENRSPRTYVSTGSQDIGKLQRENERLKKTLEKEQFFNRLLDQELKDIKSGQTGTPDYSPQGFDARPGVSKASFNILLVITLALAAFVAYTLYFNKQYNLFANRPPLAVSLPDPAVAAPVTDSVPNIIANHKAVVDTKASTPPPVTQKSTTQPAATTQKQVVEKSATKIESKPEVKQKAKAAPIERPADADENAAADQPAAAETAQVTANTPPVQRPVIGTYIISSKANFYSGPDENTLRSYFISPGVGSDKVVNALEDKNGFIYVEFKNDVGYITKGWLSKADLTAK